MLSGPVAMCGFKADKRLFIPLGCICICSRSGNGDGPIVDFPGGNKMLIIKRGQAKKTKDWDPYKSIKKKCQIECRTAYNNYVSTMLNNDIKSSPKPLWSPDYHYDCSRL
jgi:hypothetical protein